MKTAIDWVERGLVPDVAVRWGIRKLLRQRLRQERALHRSDSERAWRQHLERMRAGAIAEVPEAANAQHYEVPAAFFERVLGRHLKYSGAYWSDGMRELDAAEAAMLALTCERAALSDGQEVLELGCGWGSLSLWMAEHYPASRILSVSNSAPQRAFVLARAAERGLGNLEVRTADMNEFDPGRAFDRVVSVEMFEHMRNWEELLRRVRGWLHSDGRLFLHVFAHRAWSYPFEERDASDWMARYFFTGGLMPSDDLLARLDSPFEIERHWVVDGRHYARTAEAWCANLDARRAEVLPVLAETYGADEAERWFQRWRVFFLACAELFGYRGGSEWWVSHTRLAPRGERSGR